MNKLILRPYVQAYLNKHNKIVSLSRPYIDKGMIRDYELTDVGLEIFQNMNGENSYNDIINIINNKYSGSENETKQILQFLLDEKYIEYKNENMSYEYKKLEEEFERILPIWSQFETDNLNRFEIQKNIMKKKVAIIGCGTVGFNILTNLVATGVQNFILFDKDNVELSNLSRQHSFTRADIGIPKIKVAEKFIKERRENASVITIKSFIEKIEDLEVLKDVDIITVCADYPSYAYIGKIVQEFAFKHDIAICYAGGYRANRGRIYPMVIKNKTICFNCLVNYLEKEFKETGERIKNKDIIVSTTSQMGQYIASIVSFEILKYLSDIIPLTLINKYMVVDFLDYSLTEFPLKADCDCEYCKNIVDVQQID